jgi:uncharacterized protein (DUF58 family)
MTRLKATARVPKIRVLAGGHLVIVMTILLGVAAVQSGLNLLHALVALLLAFQAVSGFRSYLVLRKLEVSVGDVPRVDAGGEATLEVAIRNVKKNAASLSLELEVETEDGGKADVAPAWIGRIEAGETVRVRLPVRGLARGVERLKHLHVATRYPCDLFRRTLKHPLDAEVLVRPRRVAIAVPERAGGERSPRVRAPSARGGEDFRGLRPYREGDSPRAIHWRSSARAGALVVREDESSRRPPWTVVLAPVADASPAADDSRAGDASPAGDGALERDVALAAALCRAAVDAGRPTVLLVAGDPAARRLRDRVSLHAALDALARFVPSSAPAPDGPARTRAFLLGAAARAPAGSTSVEHAPFSWAKGPGSSAKGAGAPPAPAPAGKAP